MYFTAPFFFQLCQSFYEAFNARQVRRDIAKLFSAAVLAEIPWAKSMVSPLSLAWYLPALPPPCALRSFFLKGFSGFVKERVQVMKQRQFVYNGQGLRVDGNYALAKILRRGLGSECSVVYAVCGVDGSFLAPPVERRPTCQSVPIHRCRQ